MSFGSNKSKQTQTQNSTSNQDPWTPAVPYLQDFLKQIGGVNNIDITPKQQAAFGQLEASVSQGNPWSGQADKLASDAFAFDNSADVGQVDDAYTALQSSLSKYANGDYLDVTNNPELRAMLDVVGQNVQDRINRSFQGMGRSRSGINQQSVGRGVTEAQLPLLLDQFNKQQQNQINAAGALSAAAGNTASQKMDLQRFQQQMREAGLGYGEAALAARDYAPNKILELEQQKQQLPYENLALLGSLLLPTAGIGGTTNTTGTATGKAKTSGFSISDERMKDDIERVGELADGQPVYSFTYKDDPEDRVHIGLMAQDVEDVKPEAVREFNGVKAVDYGMATERAAQIVKRQLAKRKGLN